MFITERKMTADIIFIQLVCRKLPLKQKPRQPAECLWTSWRRQHVAIKVKDWIWVAVVDSKHSNWICLLILFTANYKAFAERTIFPPLYYQQSKLEIDRNRVFHWLRSACIERTSEEWPIKLSLIARVLNNIFSIFALQNQPHYCLHFNLVLSHHLCCNVFSLSEVMDMSPSCLKLGFGFIFVILYKKNILTWLLLSVINYENPVSQQQMWCV